MSAINFRVRRFIVAFVFILMAGGAFEAFACMCGRASTCERFNHASLIFVGKAVAEEREEKNGFKRVDTVFEVKEVLSGEKFKVVKLATDSGFSCAASFEIGETFLVFASGSKQEGYGTGYCSGNIPVEYADEEIAMLRKLSGSSGEGVLFGTVQREVGKDLARTDRLPVKGVRIEATGIGGGKRFLVESDAEGRYQTSVPPGRYTLQAFAPQDMLVSIFEDNPVEVRSGGCSSGFFVLKNDSRVSGRVTDAAGAPLRRVRVELVSATEGPSFQGGFNEDSNENGAFAFEGIPEGRYTLSVNFNSEPGFAHPFPTTFYPSGGDRSAAKVIEIGRGTKFDSLTFRMPPRLEEKTISGAVVWEDGSPVEGAEIKLFDMAFPGFYAGCGFEKLDSPAPADSPVRTTSFRQTGPACNLKSDAKGTFRLPLFVTRTYRLTASFKMEASGRKVEFSASSEPFNVDTPQQKLKLVLKQESVTN
jgi:hypothetical protein